MNLDKILVIADPNDSRQKALRATLDLVRGTRAQITVVGFLYDDCVEHPELLSPAAARRVKASLIRDRKAWLKNSVASLDPGTARIRHSVVWTTDISGWIASHPGEFGLVVKSGHRSEGVWHTPLDWQLLRESRIPVMIVRDRLRKRPARVLTTVDLGSGRAPQRDLNRRVLAAGRILARALAADLHLVYAVPLSALAQDLDLVDKSALVRKTTAGLRKELDALCAEFEIPPANVIIKAGPPERIVDGAASKLKAAVVVMGSRARSGLKGKLLGNTAEKVLHLNRSTVLSVRPL